MAKMHSIGIISAINTDNNDLSKSLESIVKQTLLPLTRVYLNIHSGCNKALEIAQKFKTEYPENFSITIAKEESSLAEMLCDTFSICDEEFAVFLPAGEIFSDENYLASQQELLIKTPGSTGVFCLATDKDKNIIPFDVFNLRKKSQNIIGTNYFSKYSLVAYSAIMLRNNRIAIPEWCKKCEDAIFPLILLNLGKSKLIFNDKIMVEKQSQFNLFPADNSRINRLEMLDILYDYCQNNLDNYATKTLKLSVTNEIDLILAKKAGDEDIHSLFEEILLSEESDSLLLKKYIEKYDITHDNLQLTGNLHKEWTSYKNLPLVTVVCITYNHEEFIRQAIDSFLMQKTNFKFQIFIGEDKSTDSTADIIREYAEKYPEIIVPFIRENNMGAQRNLIDMCQKAKTPYIAFCEGDDYWTDEYKLQKQFDYMESHPTLRSCFHDTEIKEQLENSWFLAEQFKNEEYENNGYKMIWPRTMKGFVPKKTYNAGTYIKRGIVHTSSMFFRWNYFADIPEWYYTHLLGDFTIWLIQLGKGRFGYIPEIMSVYRRHEGGAYYFNDKIEYMLKTRNDWIALLKNLKQYFIDNYFTYKVDTIQKRIERETNNLIHSTITELDYDKFTSVIQKTGEDGYSAIKKVYNKYYIQNEDLEDISKDLSWYFSTYSGSKEKLKAKLQRKKERFEKQQEFNRIINYWKYTLTPKNKTTWVFSGFWGRSYMDNTMYLFEYINKNCPEINAVWISNDKSVVKRITKLGFTAYLDGTQKAVDALKTAYVGFVDHYTMSDFGEFKGFNYRLKIVQLWHGVGIKKMADVVRLSTVKGSQLSSDILIGNNDSLLKKLRKSISLIKHAPNREFFERYLMYVCPGQEMIEDCHKALNIERERFFLCGYPRTAQLSDQLPEGKIKKFLFAPTYRWSKHLENIMVNDLVDSFPVIQQTMEKIGGEFIIRFHPHTWRDYSSKINSKIFDYKRIKIDKNPDIYKNMSDYFCMISDYSSIVYDFLLMNRPLIFHCPDLEFYMNADNDLKYDYQSVSPGPMTASWEETMKAVIEYSQNPQKDSEQRLKVRDFFYDMSVNDTDNSKRIVEEVKKRINL